ncbi:MAG: hypothetical protein ABEH43_00530, partial [Flavobacteriales bacterium]
EGDLPLETINKYKRGFSSPVVDWVGEDMKERVLNGKAVKDGIFRRRALKHYFSWEDNEERLWLLYVFEVWYSENFGDKKTSLWGRMINFVR